MLFNSSKDKSCCFPLWEGGSRLGITHELCGEDTYSTLLQQCCQLEQDMGQVAEAWLECQKRIDDYVAEEAMKTKQHFLKEDWEVFKQRHFIEQLNSKKEISGDSNFTETMRHLLSSQLSISDCPNCNYRRRCTCDDCSLSHILMCGIMDTPVTDDVHNNHLPPQTDSASDCQSDIYLPNMSSGSSESRSSSPFTVLQIDGPRVLPDNVSGLTFTENEDVAVISEKLGDLYSINHYDSANIEDMNGIHRELNGGVDNAALRYEGSSSSSSSSEVDAEEPIEENGSNLARIQEDNLVLGRNVIRNEETKRDNLVASYPTQESLFSFWQADQVPACCECHICKQETQGTSPSDTEVRCLPAGHQFKIPEKHAHSGLHLYPHIHGKIPLHTIPHLPPTLIHPSFYTASPFTQNKALVQNQTVNQQILSTSFQDHIYSSGLGNTTDWKSSKFLSIWGSEVMNEKDWNASNILQDTHSGSDTVASTVSELGPTVPVAARKEGIIGAESKKKENILKKKCLYHFQDAFMDTNEVVMATSSATSSVSCTATTVQSSNNQFKVSSKRSSSLSDVFHSITAEDHRCSASAAPQSSPTSLAPLSSLSSVVLSPASTSHLPSPNTPSFSRVITTAPGFVDPHPGFYATTAASPSAKENLSSAPSSVCSDPDCEGQHCENISIYDHPQYDGEDSQDDDSCSEHSSSTSASTNQKEGKYCDCCYCEFFGHGGPPAAPTSRNYTEMREKLRLRLTKRKEGQPRKLELNSDKETVIDHRKVEDLLQFINSPETKPVNSTRTAKRARHKQKKLKEKSHSETEHRDSQLLEQQCQEEEEAQQLQDLKSAKKKKKERTSTNCQKVKVLTQKCQVKGNSSSDTLKCIQTELSGKIETSSESLAKNANLVEQEETSENFVEASDDPVNGKDSKLLFKTEMTVKSHEPLSLLLNIMHQHTEDKSKQQITQISKLFAQQLKKPSKSDNQPKLRNKMQSKLKVTELQLISASKKEEKKVSSSKTRQMNSVAKSSLGRSTVLPSEQLHNKLLSQDSPQPKSKSKKNKKKKSDKGNSSIDDVFLPKDVDLDNVEMDETEREVEYFKRFCLDSARQTRQRLSINWSNFSLKKATFAAH
uniref:Protein FAM193A isoform X2 n=1 Tax=Pogona vitticeps TaxID=103695 RepID=A0ABM5GA17_9SAUR